jgi:hypothetical protein
LTVTMEETHSVGSVTGVITPSSAIPVSSSLIASQSDTGALRGGRATGLASGLI